MQAFLAFLIIYIAGGFWFFTTPEVCGPLCFPPDIAVIFWFLGFLLISLFLLFVFPSASKEDAEDAIVHYIWVGMVVVLVYEAIATLAKIFWLKS